MGQPLLSICIPTYNRSPYLKKTLESIVTADGFGEDVEVVVSDNASTDDTQLVVQEYCARYSNIKYFRNEDNIRDANFPLALDRGTGQYVKLNNDNRILEKNALTYMLGALIDHQIDHTPVFFTCGDYFHAKKGTKRIDCHSLDDFIIHLSYFSTGIWIFGSWKDDWDKVHDKMKYSALQLSQVDWFYQIVLNKPGCILMTQKWSSIEKLGKRSGYKWFQVHIDNYYAIMSEYFEAGHISRKAWNTDQRLQLRRMVRPLTSVYLYNLMPEEWELDMSGATPIFWKNFKRLPYFYFYILTSPTWMIYLTLKRLLKILIQNRKRSK